ncbi:PIN domain-containing protein [bacterium]|nr:PIN domain-containing protein [bacterium]
MSHERLLVTDTHPLVHFFCDGGKRLSKKVKKVFEESITNSGTSIFVPTPVLWELSLLIQNDDIQINKPFSYWIDDLFSYATINPLAFDYETVKICHELQYHNDPFDRAIVASAIQMELPLITNDSKMHDSKPCKLFWD